MNLKGEKQAETRCPDRALCFSPSSRAGEGEVRIMTLPCDERHMFVAGEPESPKQKEVVRGMKSFQFHTEF